MGLCPPAVVTAAIFTAVIVLDLTKKQYRLVPYHFLSGFFCTAGIGFLCSAAGDFMGWCILLIPFIILFTGFIVAWINAFRNQPTLEPCTVCGSPEPCGCRRSHKKSHHPTSNYSTNIDVSTNQSSGLTWNWPSWQFPKFDWHWPTFSLKMEYHKPAELYTGIPYLDKDNDAVYPTIPSSVTTVVTPPVTSLPGCKAA